MKRIFSVVLTVAVSLAAPAAIAQVVGSDPLHSGDGGTIKGGGTSSNADTSRGSGHHRHRHHHRRHRHR